MNINMQSVMKAAAIGAAINAVIGILSGGIGLVGVDALTFLTALFACCGGLLIPVLTGALYGYFTPGKEELGQAALGGGLSGLVAGLVYGVVQGVITIIVGLINGGAFADVLAVGAGAAIGSCCGAIIFGFILGAIGGVIWGFVQKDK